jgi:hypothetical protein
MAKYLIAISGHAGTNWQIKGTALACYSAATLGKWLFSVIWAAMAVLTASSIGVQHEIRILVL